jgi:ATP-binding cassette subfamily C protein/ATP-binding cassette subfamily C protein CydD
VAHRPAMIDLADRVVRIHEGRVIADRSVSGVRGKR